MDHRDSMFSIFHMGPASSGRGLVAARPIQNAENMKYVLAKDHGR